jgi:hypothetical protein
MDLSQAQAQSIHSQLDTLATEGLIEWCVGPISDFVNNINPFGAVDKPDGTCRILVDPTITGVNDYMLKLPLSLPTVREALLLTSPTSVLGKRDLRRGFYHVILHPSARLYMGFCDPVTQRIGRWVCLPFGASQSPSISCQVTQAAAGIFNHLFAEFGVQAHTICYVDDYFVVACDHFHLRAAFRVMDMEATLLGLEFKGPKDVGLAQPLRQLEFLGVLIRADVGDLCLPQGKHIAYAEFLSSFQQSHALASHVSRQLLEPLLGRLGFAASTFRWRYLLLQNMFAALYGEPGNGLPALCPLSVEFWDEFRYWDAVLTSPVVPFGGITRSFARDTTLPFQQLTFDHHVSLTPVRLMVGVLFSGTRLCLALDRICHVWITFAGWS